MRAAVLAAFRIVAVIAAAVTIAQPMAAQRSLRAMPVTREVAIAAARDVAPRSRIGLADSAFAAASLSLAHQFENPTLGVNYTTDAPRAHITLDVPFDWPRQRSPRISAARAQFEAATTRLLQLRATTALEADTTYTRTQVLEARTRLSARTARDADSLLVLARVRRDAGDASQLDVELAVVFAGQSASIAALDSANTIAALLRLQVIMGLGADSVDIVLAETISIDATNAANLLSDRASGSPVVQSVTTAFPVAAALQDQRAAGALERAERARRFAAPSLTLGVETHNPGGQGGLLPLVGLAIPIPLFNRNASAIRTAQANLMRASAVLSQMLLEQEGALKRAQRDATFSRQRAERSVRLVNSAERIAAMSLLAYQEEAATLPSVLEAQRSARDAIAQFIDDLAAMRVAERLLRFLLSGIPTLNK